MNKTEGDWKSGGYAMVISSIRTSVYQIEQCIDGLLCVNDQLCKSASSITNTSHLMKSGSVSNLNHQENYICLNDGGDIDDPSTVKQRSPIWFDIRKQPVITGSSINKAIGLNGLKTQI